MVELEELLADVAGLMMVVDPPLWPPVLLGGSGVPTGAIDSKGVAAGAGAAGAAKKGAGEANNSVAMMRIPAVVLPNQFLDTPLLLLELRIMN